MASQSPAAVGMKTLSARALLVRWIVSIHLMALVVQLATAVAFAAGWSAALIVPHATNAWIVGAAGIVQTISLGIPGAPRVSAFTRVLAVAVVVGEGTQLHFGLTQGLATHVTVAMLIWAGALALFIRVWAPTWKLPPQTPSPQSASGS